MSALAKATLVKLGKKGEETEFPVQFNPASLKLTHQNAFDKRKTKNKRTTQALGKNASSLSFDLIVDTAEEGTATEPRSVRDRTAALEQFVLPPQVDGKKKKKAPPLVRFQWGKLKFEGMIKDLTITFELFSSEGIPLRAKMSVTIREHDPKYLFNQPAAGSAGSASDGATAGAGAGGMGAGGADGNAVPAKKKQNPTPDGPAAATPVDDPARTAAGQPGTAGGAPTDRTVPAIEGESLPEFAARNQLDPAAWRAMAKDIPDPSSLSGGQDIDFNSELSARAGLAARAGFGVDLEASVDGSLGLDVAVSGSVEAGMALSAAGGVGPALARAADLKSNVRADESRSAFADSMGGGGTAAGSGGGGPSGGGGAASAAGTPGRLPVVAGPPPRVPDARTSAWGFGIPLRTHFVPAAQERAEANAGAVRLRPYGTASSLEQTHPRAPAWINGRTLDNDGAALDGASPARRSGPCGCPPKSKRGRK